MRPNATRARHLLPMVVAGWLGALSAYLYTVTVVQPGWSLAADLHAGIVDGTAPSPYRSRLLLPFVAEALARVVPLDTAYLLLYFALFPLAFCSLFALLRLWHPTTHALLGTLLMAAVMPLAMRDHYFQPGTWLELVLVIAALRLLARPHLDLRWYAAVAVAAALNRETGMLLGLLLLAVEWPRARAGRGRLLLAAAAPVLAYAAIRVVRGGGPAVEHDLLTRNLHDLPVAVIQITLFSAVIAFLAWAGWATAPRLLRRAALVVPVYLGFVAAFGIWREARMLVPMLPIALAIGLGALRDLDADDEPAAEPEGRREEPVPA